MKNYFWLVVFSLLLFSCRISYLLPKHPFENDRSSEKPDYANEKNWAALPSKKDNADRVPKKSSLKENQQNALADVFFIHPTSYKRRKWNASLTNKKAKRITNKYSIKLQASVFNESCKVYAPYYRQATLASYFYDGDDGKKALDFAYEDVKNAFEFYLKNHNNGRPIIIAGHSQGTTHAIRLLKEYFDNKPLAQQLVTAYLIGMPVSQNEFNSIHPCDSSSQISCFVSWMTFLWKKNSETNEQANQWKVQKDKNEEDSTNCTNPLSWKRDTVFAGREKNSGSVPFTFLTVHYNNVDAQCQDGILWIHTPKGFGYPFFVGGNYHMMDYNLFYLNIRENVKDRINNFLKR